MISPSKGRYDMLLLQPVGPSLHMTTYIQENWRTTAHCQGTTMRVEAVQAVFYSESTEMGKITQLGDLENRNQYKNVIFKIRIEIITNNEFLKSNSSDFENHF